MSEDRIKHETKHPEYDLLKDKTCYWCVFLAGLEPTNRGARGWQILDWNVKDGIFFVFEDLDGNLQPIHVTCWACLAGVKSRLEMLKNSTRWWFMTPTKYTEYPSAEAFKKHFPNAFEVKERG